MEGGLWDGRLVGCSNELEEKGVEISGGDTAEVWGKTTGGLKTGAVYTVSWISVRG